MRHARYIECLELNGGMEDGKSAGFERNEGNPLETDVIIIDEMSMVDISLMYSVSRRLSQVQGLYWWRCKPAAECWTRKRTKRYNRCGLFSYSKSLQKYSGRQAQVI